MLENSLMPSRGSLSAARFLVLASMIGCQVHSNAPAAQSAPSGNLVANPGFEEVRDGLPTGWTVNPEVRDRGAARASDQAPASGKAVLELVPNRSNTRQDQPFGMAQIVSAQGVRGQRIQVSASIRVTQGAAAGVLVLALAKGRPVGQVVAAQASPSNSFETKTASLQLGGDVEQLLIGCIVNGTSGKAWFDDVFVGVNASAAPVRSAESAGGEFNASIRINAGRVLKSVDRRLFGTNLNWAYNADSSWDPKEARIRPAIVRAARELGVSMVRFPGGTFADYYHWRDGVGPQNTRPERPHHTDDGRSRNVVGTAEIVSFAREIGAEPLLGVNITTGTAAEASDWVAYCNRSTHPDRARHGHPEPYRVRYWEIGNEQYIKQGVPSTQKAYLTPAQYARRYLEFATAMKGADPSIQLFAIGGVNTRQYRLLEDDSWTRVLLQQAGHAIDYLAIHNAYAPSGASSSGASFEEVYQAMMAFPVLLSENFDAVNREIERYAPQHAGRIRIAVTEWGPLFHFLPSDPWVGHGKTLGSALFVAGAMQSFLRAPRVEIANFFKFTEHAFMGWTDSQGNPKPSYYALQMYSRHFGTQLVEASVDSPSYASRRVGVVDAVAQVPYLDAVASLGADGSTLHVIVINRNLRQSARARLALSGFRPRAAGRTWTLTAASLDANNGDDLPAIPGLRWARQAEAPKGSLFHSGRPGSVAPVEKSFAGAASAFDLVFPPMSVTAVELARTP